MLALAGCRADVVIGVAPSDASAADAAVDAAPEFDAASTVMQGAYGLSHDALVDVSCADPAHDSLYYNLMPADVGLISGVVELAPNGETLVVSGEAITAGYGQPQLELAKDLLPDQPPDLLFGVVAETREGPGGLTLVQTILGFYETGATETHVDGESGALFRDDSLGSECGVLFAAFLVR